MILIMMALLFLGDQVLANEATQKVVTQKDIQYVLRKNGIKGLPKEFKKIIGSPEIGEITNE